MGVPLPEASKKIAVKKTAKSQAGIAEEFEDIIKTTTCDRGCGCDKKKIRFKHSYVKIRVTSPDISSLCPCPDECIPGVKGGVFVDNEGIKVTVGSAIGVPTYSKENTNINDRVLRNNHNKRNKVTYNGTSHVPLVVLFDHTRNIKKMPKTFNRPHGFEAFPSSDINSYDNIKVYDADAVESKNKRRRVQYENLPKDHTKATPRPTQRKRFIDSSRYFASSSELSQIKLSSNYLMKEIVSQDSFNSISPSKSQISVTFSTSDISIILSESGTRSSVSSVITIAESTTNSASSCLYYSISDDRLSNTFEESDWADESFTNHIDYSSANTVTSYSNEVVYTQDASSESPLTNYNNYTPRNVTSKEKVFHQITEKLKKLHKLKREDKRREKTALQFLFPVHCRKVLFRILKTMQAANPLFMNVRTKS
ncbi:unnamed protein product [Arctia plantaginis]|uniref:Uncharacterized protein n=1 Tax=Arctia plantaginis TaxID=874455 RepID=A0A8S0Z2C3_ARCPL|nr:unnamed protein product [Arctia plantaginis]